MQDNALYKCCLLLSEVTALEDQPRRVVPKTYLSLGDILERMSDPTRD